MNKIRGALQALQSQVKTFPQDIAEFNKNLSTDDMIGMFAGTVSPKVSLADDAFATVNQLSRSMKGGNLPFESHELVQSLGKEYLKKAPKNSPLRVSTEAILGELKKVLGGNYNIPQIRPR